VGSRDREFPFEGDFRGASWSRSRRRLAVALESGRILVIEADREEARPMRVTRDWIELRREHRFWRARRVGATVELRFGRVWERGAQHAIRHPDDATAARDLERRIIIKEGEGYTRVP
jgi:hypothetical protein